MKKFIYCTVIALITLACSQDDTLLTDVAFDAPKTIYGQIPQAESRASINYQPKSWSDMEMGIPNSRTYASVSPDNEKEYIQYWSPSDLISVFFTNKMEKYILTELGDENGDGDNEKDYGRFELVDENVVPGKPLENYFYAVYPYKAKTSINYLNGDITFNFANEQHYCEDSYANGENGMIARIPQKGESTLYFQNFCSYLKLKIKDNSVNPKSVRQITFESNNPEDKIAGSSTIKYDGNVPTVKMKANASNQITLNCGSGVQLGQTETSFWFVLPGNITFTEGFTVTITFTDHTYLKKTTTKRIFIERNHIKPMASFETGIDDDAEMTGPIRYKYNVENTTEPYPIGEEFYDENNKKLQVVNQKYDETTGEWVVYLSGKLKTIGGNNFEERIPDIEYIKVEADAGSPIVLGEFAFFNSTAEKVTIYNDVQYIGKAALKGSTINELIINGNVSEIREDAFSACDKLQKFETTSVGTIQARAFLGCTDLSMLSIEGVTYLGVSAFENCSSLPSIVLNSVVTIEDAAFMGCSGLTSAVISKHCTMIGEGAFCNATNLESVYCNAVKPPFIKTDNPGGSYIFDSTSSNLCIYIPDGSYGDYTNEYYFENNTGYGSSIRATVNWWFVEYIDILNEI